MIDIYKYKDAKGIEITDIDDEIFVGTVVSVNDVDDEDEDIRLEENSVTIAVDRRPITFPVSEIKTIGIIN